MKRRFSGKRYFAWLGRMGHPFSKSWPHWAQQAYLLHRYTFGSPIRLRHYQAWVHASVDLAQASSHRPSVITHKGEAQS